VETQVFGNCLSLQLSDAFAQAAISAAATPALRATLMPCVPSCDYGGTSADIAAQGPCSRIPVPQ